VDILVAHNFYQRPGGEDQCMAAEVAMLRAHGHNVVQYCVHNDAIKEMSLLRAAGRTVWSGSAFRELRRLLEAHRPQIAHFHNIFPLISPAAYYACRAAGVPVVQTVHNFRLFCANGLLVRDGGACEDCLGKLFAWPALLHKCYRGNRAATGAVAVMMAAHWAIGTWRSAVAFYIAPTEFLRRTLVRSGLPPERIVVKPHFTAGDLRPGSGCGGYALYAGRLSTEKGIDTMIEAWSRLGGVLPLKIVGDGPMAAIVREAALRNAAIEWLGWQPHEKVHNLMRDAVFVVVPSRTYEVLPFVVIEAFAAGTPVLASGSGALAELVEDCRTGRHFQPGDPEDLVEKVRHILANPAQLAAMRQAARQESALKYAEEPNYDALMAIYSAAIGTLRVKGPAGRAML
jgi:glycosyltransferase involved in cell wall biosynthesis